MYVGAPMDALRRKLAGWTKLHAAAADGDIAEVRSLVQRYPSDTNKQSKVCKHRDNAGTDHHHWSQLPLLRAHARWPPFDLSTGSANTSALGVRIGV